MLKPKAIISACLLGACCRYDGQTKVSHEVLEAFAGYEVIPFCPEAPLFGTPRERISVVLIDGKKRIITDETHEDVTELLEDEIHRFIKQFPHAKKIVLKSKSPSCGLGTTPILDKEKNILKYGNGIAAERFQKKYQNSEFLDETAFI